MSRRAAGSADAPWTTSSTHAPDPATARGRVTSIPPADGAAATAAPLTLTGATTLADAVIRAAADCAPAGAARDSTRTAAAKTALTDDPGSAADGCGERRRPGRKLRPGPNRP